MRDLTLAQIPVPSTAVAQAATEVSRRHHSEALFNHCVRSYLFAASYAELNAIGYDEELLYVASILHDVGLSAAFDSHTVAFEQAGGEVVWAFAAGAGWDPARRDRAAGVVVAHMADDVDRAADPEGWLLERSTGLDISGSAVGDWPVALRAEVLAAYPRLDLATEFTRCFADQASRKPDSTAARAVQSGIAERMRSNPLESPAHHQ